MVGPWERVCFRRLRRALEASTMVGANAPPVYPGDPTGVRVPPRRAIGGHRRGGAGGVPLGFIFSGFRDWGRGAFPPVWYFRTAPPSVLPPPFQLDAGGGSVAP